MDQKIGLWQPYRDEELKQQKWNYWDLWQATPFMTTKQMTQYAVNYRLYAY
jgi:spermidine/putrescine-binding protein